MKAPSQSRPVPDWFEDAKFGIFIHWSLFSIPAYAPVSGKNTREILAAGGVSEQMKRNPYSEWYLNSIQIEGSAAKKYHDETYGEDFSYFDFAPQFREEAKKWEPNEWARQFKHAGARYVVLVTKHHDGFLLWPSDTPNPHRDEYQSERDLVGELAAAVKREGMRFGVYYSGGLDWSFPSPPITDAASFFTNGPVTKEYATYAESHFRELMEKYEPDILWNDICYPPDGDVAGLAADFYTSNPEGVVNDRWLRLPKLGRKAILRWPLRGIFNAIVNRVVKTEDINPPQSRDADFTTPEYALFRDIVTKKWETTRGVGHSFGYNRLETQEHFLASEEAIRFLIDAVSKNGNLLLNVGPRADGSIQDEQRACIRGIGEWLAVNGDAIYGTRPWTRAEGRTTSGIEIRFTQKPGKLFVILMDTPAERSIEIENLNAQVGATIRHLGSESDIEWSQEGANLTVHLPREFPYSPACTLVLSTN